MQGIKSYRCIAISQVVNRGNVKHISKGLSIHKKWVLTHENGTFEILDNIAKFQSFATHYWNQFSHLTWITFDLHLIPNPPR